MIDYHVNLAKDLVGSETQRRRFYNGMLIYLALCAVALVFTAYLSAINMKHYLKNRRQRRQLQSSIVAVSGLEPSAFKHPDKVYDALKADAARIGKLKAALEGRVQLLPVVYNLFSILPQGVALQSLSAGDGKISFGMEMPLSSNGSGDFVRNLKEGWETNPELMRRVKSIRPLTGERRRMGNVSVFYVEFECILKKQVE